MKCLFDVNESGCHCARFNFTVCNGDCDNCRLRKKIFKMRNAYESL